MRGLDLNSMLVQHQTEDCDDDEDYDDNGDDYRRTHYASNQKHLEELNLDRCVGLVLIPCWFNIRLKESLCADSQSWLCQGEIRQLYF